MRFNNSYLVYLFHKICARRVKIKYWPPHEIFVLIAERSICSYKVKDSKYYFTCVWLMLVCVQFLPSEGIQSNYNHHVVGKCFNGS